MKNSAIEKDKQTYGLMQKKKSFSLLEDLLENKRINL